MKLGLVLECDTGGSDELVLTCLARRLYPDIEIESASLGSKRQVFLNGPGAAKNLVEVNKCDLVLIVWDLKPYWKPKAGRDCQIEAEELRHSLTGFSRETRAKIRLLCITWELETWLIADSRAINSHLSTDAHKAKFRCNKPLERNDPKAVLDKECKKYRGRSRGYIAVREAIQIAKLIPNTKCIKKIQSFERFVKLICANPDADFQQEGKVCNDLTYQAHQLGRT